MDLIVQMVFGSHLYGTATEKSDKDWKGVFLPTLSDFLLQRVPKSINESSKINSTSKNSADDFDKEWYSLPYFLHLACEGETVALDMLHASSSVIEIESDIWIELVVNRERFYTRSLKSFVGYARRQAAKYGVKGSRLAEARMVLAFLKSQPVEFRLLDVWDILPVGEHLAKTKNEQDDLYVVCGKCMVSKGRCHYYVAILEQFIEQYGARARLAESNNGIDWKAVSHAFRAAYQVQHILEDGGYCYPLPETDWLCRVKSGTLQYASEVAPKLDALMDKLEVLSSASSLPEKVDRNWWNEWLEKTLRKRFKL